MATFSLTNEALHGGARVVETGGAYSPKWHMVVLNGCPTSGTGVTCLADIVWFNIQGQSISGSRGVSFPFSGSDKPLWTLATALCSGSTATDYTFLQKIAGAVVTPTNYAMSWNSSATLAASGSFSGATINVNTSQGYVLLPIQQSTPLGKVSLPDHQ